MEFILFLILLTLLYGSAAVLTGLKYVFIIGLILWVVISIINWVVTPKVIEPKIEDSKKIVLPAPNDNKEWNKILYSSLFIIVLIGFALI